MNKEIVKIWESEANALANMDNAKICKHEYNRLYSLAVHYKSEYKEKDNSLESIRREVRLLKNELDQFVADKYKEVNSLTAENEELRRLYKSKTEEHVTLMVKARELEEDVRTLRRHGSELVEINAGLKERINFLESEASVIESAIERMRFNSGR